MGLDIVPSKPSKFLFAVNLLAHIIAFCLAAYLVSYGIRVLADNRPIDFGIHLLIAGSVGMVVAGLHTLNILGSHKAHNKRIKAYMRSRCAGDEHELEHHQERQQELNLQSEAIANGVKEQLHDIFNVKKSHVERIVSNAMRSWYERDGMPLSDSNLLHDGVYKHLIEALAKEIRKPCYWRPGSILSHRYRIDKSKQDKLYREIGMIIRETVGTEMEDVNERDGYPIGQDEDAMGQDVPYRWRLRHDGSRVEERRRNSLPDSQAYGRSR